MKKLLIIDGQGGRIGRALLEQMMPYSDRIDLYAVGTNAVASANMLKAGNVKAAAGENSVLVLSRKADIIAGPIGIIIADAMLGEITPAMAMAVAGLEPMEDVTVTGFMDDETIPAWSKGNVSAALKAGAIRGGRDERGASVFRGQDTVTYAQAAVMLDRLLNVTDVPVEVFAVEMPTHWAMQAAVDLCACGVLRVEETAVDALEQPLTLGEAAVLLDGALEIRDRR